MFLGSLFALFSATLSGVVPNLLRNVTRRISPLYVNSLKLLYAFFFFTLFLPLFFPRPFPEISLKGILLIVFISLSGPFVAWTSYMYAISKSDVSLVHPVMGTYPAYAILYDFIFFSVKPNFLSIFGYFFILLGLYFITGDRGSPKGSKKGLPFAFLTAFLWGTNSFLFKIILKEVNPLFLSYLRLLFTIPFALSIVLFYKFKKNLKPVKRDNFLILLSGIIGDFWVVFFYFISIKLSYLYIVVPISATSPIFSSLIAKFLHKEKIMLKRAFGIISAFIGTFILVIISYFFS